MINEFCSWEHATAYVCASEELINRLTLLVNKACFAEKYLLSCYSNQRKRYPRPPFVGEVSILQIQKHSLEVVKKDWNLK